MTDMLQETITRLLPEITELRRRLHAHPEIRFEEHWTADQVATCLQEAGVPFTRGHAGGTGIVATIAGKNPGKTVALRADMDALEIQERNTDLPYASTLPNRMHACGHDGHTANLCGVARVLMAHRDQLQGTVKLIFQPAEEQAAGGKLMVDEGLLEDVHAVFALHAWPGIPEGQAGVLSGCAMASADMFHIRVNGQGGHAASPGATLDPIPVAAQIVTGLQSIVSRKVHPWDAGVVTVTRLRAGQSMNIIPDTAWVEGTHRALQAETREMLTRSIIAIAENTAAAHGMTAEVTIDGCGYPVLHNDPEMSEFARRCIQRRLGDARLFACKHPFMTAEDFAFYLERLPGAYIFLGNDRPDLEGPPAQLHSPYFNFNDQTLPHGMLLMSRLAIDYLSGA